MLDFTWEALKKRIDDVPGLYQQLGLYAPYLTDLHIQKAYTNLGTSSMQILLLSAHACMHFA